MKSHSISKSLEITIPPHSSEGWCFFLLMRKHRKNFNLKLAQLEKVFLEVLCDFDYYLHIKTASDIYWRENRGKIKARWKYFPQKWKEIFYITIAGKKIS